MQNTLLSSPEHPNWSAFLTPGPLPQSPLHSLTACFPCFIHPLLSRSLIEALCCSSAGVCKLCWLTFCPCCSFLFLCLSCSHTCSCCCVMLNFLTWSGRMKLQYTHLVMRGAHRCKSKASEQCRHSYQPGTKAYHIRNTSIVYWLFSACTGDKWNNSAAWP